MGFDDLVKKGQDYYSNNKEEVNKYAGDAKDAYDTFNKTEGTFTDKAKTAFGEFKQHEPSAKSDSKDSEEKK